MLISFGFSQLFVDSAIFSITSSNLLYVLDVYVDDSILVGRNGPFIIVFKAAFDAQFDIEDLGPASWLLGCSVTRDRTNRTLAFSQSQYVADILEQFSMSTYSSSPTPMSAKPSADAILDQPFDVKMFPFASLLGKLLYCANMTRLDISTYVSLLSRHMSSPTWRH